MTTMSGTLRTEASSIELMKYRSPLATEAVWCSWCVVEDLLNLLHDLRGQLRQELESLDVVLDLGHTGCSKNHSADVGVLRSPCEGKLCDVASESLSDLCQLSDLGDLGLALFRLQLLDGVLEESLVGSETRVLWDLEEVWLV